MKINFPEALKKAIRRGYVISIIQFGSSLRTDKYQDIDLAIVIKKDCYKDFLEIVWKGNFGGFDISLIKEKEIQGPNRFRFGKHGAHFLSSLIQGKTLYGKNPFKKFKVSRAEIEKSIILSLFVYIEDIRRVIFEGKVKKGIKRRWPKFLKLCLYLLNNDLKYLEVLNLDNEEIKKYFKKCNINCNWVSKTFKNSKDLFIAYEMIWEKVLKKKKLIPTQSY